MALVSPTAYHLNQKRYPRVTAVLSVISKPAVAHWMARLVAARAVTDFDHLARLVATDPVLAVSWLLSTPGQVREEAADQGRRVHEAIRALVLGNRAPEIGRPVPDGYITAFQKFWADLDPQSILAAEGLVVSEAHQYAGTVDLLVARPGEALLIDLKTSPAFYPQHDLQVTAYAFADLYHDPRGRPHEMPQVARCLIVRLGPEGTYAVRELTPDPGLFGVFLSCLHLHRWLESHGTGRGPAGTIPEEVDNAGTEIDFDR